MQKYTYKYSARSTRKEFSNNKGTLFNTQKPSKLTNTRKLQASPFLKNNTESENNLLLVWIC